MKQCPQLAQVVLQRCTAQAQALARHQLARSLRGFAVGVLDVLRFVEDQDVQRHFSQQLNVFGQQGIGGQDHVVIVEVLDVFFATGAVQRQYLELWREVRRFVHPVWNQAGGHHHHCRAIQPPRVLFAQNVRQSLQGFA